MSEGGGRGSKRGSEKYILKKVQSFKVSLEMVDSYLHKLQGFSTGEDMRSLTQPQWP